ncbi:macro domain-containing protein [Mycolicibacterium mucogenicum]|uniref:type II toxin-antitoxin system antitoxin DNA ADP-ribosyl glycohydrolase DarG n=1 Tax=Mycolicibacterium mucogenicum TaxID=56689 RepID=UPI00076A3D01|nr:macro domain-containing protein [Mycolicibacterium mucogenicum]MCX8559045.1 macro domain-containing protein [Mycolicibacterium mucogenicum]
MRLVTGNVLDSPAQTIVNTVNCVGVMGKGVALAFKKRYPEMFKDYVGRCDRGEVQLGRPYLYPAKDHLIINFPTKDHWRAVSRLQDIVEGLRYLQEHYREWGVTSLAVPPLGCGNGQLEWKVVAPTLIRYLSELDIPVDLYVPHGESVEDPQLALDVDDPAAAPAEDTERFVPPEWVAVVAILDRLQRREHHWPVGRIMFQKLVYFASQTGIPTGLEFERNSYGPFSAQLNRHVARLQNNGLAVELKSGNMFRVLVGPTYRDAVDSYRESMEQWRPAVDRTVDLMARMNTTTAEVAATVHYAAADLADELGRRPTASEVIAAVEEWKIRRKPAVHRADIVDALAVLGMRGWLDVDLDDDAAALIDDLIDS